MLRLFLRDHRLSGLWITQHLELFTPNLAAHVRGLKRNAVGWANLRAGQTADTIRRRLVEGRRDLAAPSTIDRGNGGHTNVVADPGAEAAEDTIVRVRVGRIRGLLNAVLEGPLLDQWCVRTAGKQEVEDHPAGLDDPVGVGNDRHPLINRMVACCDDLEPIVVPVGLRHVNHAQTATAPRLETVELTKRRHLDTGRACRIEKSGVRVHSHPSSIDLQRRHQTTSAFSSSCLGKVRIVSVGQTSRQAPQEMQASWSMTCSSLTTPVMASTGQAL